MSDIYLRIKWFIDDEIKIYKKSIDSLKWVNNYNEEQYPPVMKQLETACNTLKKLKEDLEKKFDNEYYESQW